MRSQNWLTTTFRRVVTTVVVLLLTGLTACKHTQPEPEFATYGDTPEAPAAPAKPNRVKYNETYDAEIKEIMDLASLRRWEEAQVKANALYERDPKNLMVERVYTWVGQQRQKQREQALEDKIREVDSKNSVFSPTIPSLLGENRDRGLPATKDVRDTVQKIENSPYIPETYGKLIKEKGPLFDMESTKGRMFKVIDKEITIHLDNVPLETILLNLSQSAGVNIVADKSLPALKQMLSANLEKVKLEEFLRYVGRNYDLQFQVGDELIWVTDGKDPKKTDGGDQVLPAAQGVCSARDVRGGGCDAVGGDGQQRDDGHGDAPNTRSS